METVNNVRIYYVFACCVGTDAEAWAEGLLMESLRGYSHELRKPATRSLDLAKPQPASLHHQHPCPLRIHKATSNCSSN